MTWATPLDFCHIIQHDKLWRISSSTFGDILIIIMFDVCFKMTKKHVFQGGCWEDVEKRVFCHFKAHIKHYDDQNVTKSWGTNWSKFFIFESLLKTRKFAKISKNVRNFLNGLFWFTLWKPLQLIKVIDIFRVQFQLRPRSFPLLLRLFAVSHHAQQHAQKIKPSQFSRYPCIAIKY